LAMRGWATACREPRTPVSQETNIFQYYQVVQTVQNWKENYPGA
jgi:hypothetical protein